jgi:predicted amidophosphoribosyltransferase
MGFVCPSCGARFEKELKFCGECGTAMKVAKA